MLEFRNKRDKIIDRRQNFEKSKRKKKGSVKLKSRFEKEKISTLENYIFRHISEKKRINKKTRIIIQWEIGGNRKAGSVLHNKRIKWD